MDDQFTASIVSIMDAWGRIKGVGFLVSEKRVVTCAHVVAQALDIPRETPDLPDGEVRLGLPFANERERAIPQISASVIFWRPPEPLSENADNPHILKYGSDIAVLKLKQIPPAGSEPGRIVAEENLWKHPFRAFGFPFGLDIGEFAWGIILGKLTNGWMQIEGITETGRFVSPGFSGTPVWDEDVGGIVGMIVSAYEQPQQLKAAYFIPSTILIDVYPDLKQQVIPPCPYRGLSTFRERDAPYFFGREDFTKKLVVEVGKRPMVAVTGPSGSGKSSVVFAGLIPYLRTDPDWIITSFSPEKHPFNNLASALFPLLESPGQMTETDQLNEIRKLALSIRDDIDFFQDAVKRILEKHPGASRLLLVADQFEGLFTQCQDTQEHRDLLDVLLSALIPQPYKQHPELTLVITLRIDFLKQALLYPPFADVLQDANMILIPMNPHELQSAIEKPAHKLNVRIEEGLKERIMEAVSHSPGNLPLLEFTMQQLWKAQKYGKLTNAAYDKIGGVEKSLAQHAEEIYDRFPEEEKERLHRIFIKLVHPVEGTEDTGRTATRTELGDENWSLVTRLASERLVVTGQDTQTGEETVKIIHEALITEWERFRKWMEADRVFRIWQDHLQLTIQQWETSGHDESVLLRGFLLDEAEDWLRKRPADLSKTETGFIRSGLALRKKEQAEHEAAREKEKRLQRRIMLGIAIGMFVALILASWAVIGWQHAQKERQIAVARRLLAQAELVKREHPALLPFSALLAAEAIKLSPLPPSVEFDQALRSGLNLLPRPVTLLNHENEINSIAFSPDGNYLVTAGSDHTAVLWNIHDEKDTRPLVHGDKVNGSVFSSNGRFVATAGWDCIARVWDLTNDKVALCIGHQNSLNSIAFSPDDNYVATASSDHTLCIWETRSGKRVNRLPHGDNVSGVAFSPDGRFIASASWDHTARVWDLSNGKESTRMLHDDKVSAVAFSPDGRFIATASFDHTARVSYAEEGENIYRMPHDGHVTAVAFSPDGRLLATASWDHTARIWDLSNGKELARMRHEDNVPLVAFSPKGDYLATASADRTSRVWQIKTGKEFIRMVHEDALTDMDFSPDGRYIATASKDRTARVWEFSSLYKENLFLHEDKVKALIFSPDGKYLATAEQDHTVMLWDMQSRRKTRVLRCDEKPTSIAFSPDMRYLAAAGEDASITLIDTNSGLEAGRMAHQMVMNAVALSSDGRYLATDGDDHTVHVIKAGSGQGMGSIPQEKPVTALALSPNGDYLAVATKEGIKGISASRGSTIGIWNLSDSREVTHIKYAQEIGILSLSDAGKYIAVAGKNCPPCIWQVGEPPVKIWELNNLKNGPPMKYPEDVTAISLSANGAYIAVAGKDRNAYVWKIGKQKDSITGEQDEILMEQDAVLIEQDATLIAQDAKTMGQDVTIIGENAVLTEQVDEIVAIALSQDGRYLTTACRDNTAYVWEVRKEKDIHAIAKKIFSMKHTEKIAAIAFDPDRQYLTITDKKNMLKVWDVKNHTEIGHSIFGHKINAIVFSPNGRYLASAGGDNTVHVWESSTSKRISSIQHKGIVNKLVFSPKGRYLATASADHTVHIWDSSIPQETKDLQHCKGVNDVAFSPDERYLATACIDHTARIWEVSTGREQALITHNSSVKAVAFSPNGGYLVSVCTDHTIGIWKTPTGRKKASMKHDDGVNSLAFSPDGEYLATACEDGTARIWKVSTGQEMARIRHDKAINDLSFSPDGKYLATASSDKTVRLSLWQPDDMISEICTRLPRNLIIKKWREHFGNESECKACPQIQ